MALKVLFDEKRRGELRAAIKKDRLAAALPKKADDTSLWVTSSENPEPGAIHEDTGVGVGPDGSARMKRIRVIPAPVMSEEDVRRKMEQLAREVDSTMLPGMRIDGSENPREQVRKIKKDLEQGAKEMKMHLLVAAILTGRVERVKDVHEDGANLNADTSGYGFADSNGDVCTTPLQVAESLRHSEIINYLKKNGAK